MLETILARYRVWERTHATIRYFNHLDNRQLADMGIERDNIVVIAMRGAEAEEAQRQAARSAHQRADKKERAAPVEPPVRRRVDWA